MFYQNARIFVNGAFHHGAFEVVDGRFGAVLPASVPADAVDLGGATVIPGLIEVHSHGAAGFDFSDGNYEGLKEIAKFYLSCGVTSFAPASMTLPYDVLEKAFATGRRLADERPEGCAVIRGIQMEGPYFSYKKRGAQNPDYLKEPDFAGFRALYEGCGGLVRIVDVAPELPGAAAFVAKAKDLCTVSIAHTDSDYDHAKAAVDAGVTHLTHLYNAMPAIHHRNPGVIPAAVENPNVRAEIIADGFHIHPASVRLAFTMFKNRMILVSDSGRCAGKDEGYQFELGGQMAELRGGVAKLVGTDTIACSASNLWACLKNVLSWGISEEEAVLAATWNPACALGVQNEVGSIETGKVADFLICQPGYTDKRVFLAGRELGQPIEQKGNVTMKSFEYVITEPIGIHARPAGMLNKEVRKYQSTVTVYRGEKGADAKRLMALMQLGVKCGETVRVTIDGPDAETVAPIIEEFFKTNL